MLGKLPSLFPPLRGHRERPQQPHGDAESGHGGLHDPGAVQRKAAQIQDQDNRPDAGVREPEPGCACPPAAA